MHCTGFFETSSDPILRKSHLKIHLTLGKILDLDWSIGLNCDLLILFCTSPDARVTPALVSNFPNVVCNTLLMTSLLRATFSLLLLRFLPAEAIMNNV
jgi:hypothetical protein